MTPVLRDFELESIRGHAERDYVREACGFVLRRAGADGGQESLVHEARNIMDALHARDAETYPVDARAGFAVAPEDMAELLRHLEAGFTLQAIYHSHTTPGSTATFSARDAAWSLAGGAGPAHPDAAQIVLAMPGGLPSEACAYRWDGRAFVLVGRGRYERRLDGLHFTQPRILPLVDVTSAVPA